MPDQTLSDLPEAVRSIIYSDQDFETNARIKEDFYLDDEQFQFVLRTILDIILKVNPVLDLPTILIKMPHGTSIDIKKLTLRIVADKFWPLQNYLGDVDVLIHRLGGQIPMAIPLATQAKSKDEIAHGSAKEILQQHKQFEELYLTQKPVKDDDDRLKPPSAKNWLKDYLHTMGAEGASSLKRSQFMAKSRNVAKLNDEEKKNLLNFLLSYEEDVLMYWKVAEDQYLVVESDLPESQQESIKQDKMDKELPELLEYFKNTQQNYQKLFDDKRQGLAVEIGDHTAKLTDIIWESMGLGEAERGIVALYELIERHSFWQTLKTDQRFQGIAARAIDAKYGTEAKNFWNKDLAPAPMQSIFWRLILVDKLKFEEGKAAIIADLYSKKLEQKISPLYLDRKSGKFLFREVVYEDRAFRFA